MVGLIFIIWRHYRLGKRKHAAFKAEVDRAEESVRRGFALLSKDLEGEFELIKKAKLSRALTAQERHREDEIRRDLEIVKNHVGEEIWELEKKAS